MVTRFHDESWLRSGQWVADSTATEQDFTNLTIIGVPAHKTSVTPTNADKTPAALRDAMYWYSTWSWEHDLDISGLSVKDVGDISDPDFEDGNQRVIERMEQLRGTQDLLVALGGDNAITYTVARGLWGSDIATAGLITVDAHHDLRNGISNGSPVRQLIQDAGLDGKRVVQIAISDFANSPIYAQRAKDFGITVITRAQLRHRTLDSVMDQALTVAGAAGGQIHYDLDVDVCDRTVAPACPAATPGGLSADDIRHLTFLATSDGRVTSMDITEIDATIDTEDQRTIRLGALCILEAASGVASRKK
ncbi:MAG: formimidoylglutamase [Actinobacteria bacterium]|uniref:Unannotated protein n=1 Tax=freshwater metagenome TaxID=449393 RepID=A0A6J5Z345_9ZZZZ|nr:formimidoylglutamase [Actinomycetota bacterium]